MGIAKAHSRQPQGDLAQLADQLRELLAGTSDARVKRALSALEDGRGENQGRPQICDAANLAEARSLVAQGTCSSWNEAFTLVAMKYSGEAKRIRAIAERLRRKHKKSIHENY